jgi:hypothetical protein
MNQIEIRSRLDHPQARRLLQMHAPLMRVLLETLVVVLLFGAATWWGLHYWRLSLAAGREPQFYQEYFEPAVMMACDKGFVVATPPIPVITEFLSGRRATFECSEIPANASLGPPVLQAAWRYLMSAVAIGWKVLGVSWNAIGPMAAVTFGTCITLAYAIFRLALPWPIALCGAGVWAVSSVHLLQLPHFRDYTKGPFILACVWILGLLVRKSRPALAVLGLAAAYGLTVGIGYGVRTDLLVAILPMIVTIACFLPGGFRSRWPTKFAALATFALSFSISAWPVIGAVIGGGSCQWHFALLGLTTDFTNVLGLKPALYDWGNKYSDRWVYATVASFAERQNPTAPLLDYCSHRYDIVSFDYLWHVIITFPADMVTRGLASADRIIELPFAVLDRPLPALASDLYDWRFLVLRHFTGTGRFWIAGALVAVATTDLRLGGFLLFLVLYFSSYPAIQYGYRHVFYLEVIPIWAIAFLCYLSLLSVRGARQLLTNLGAFAQTARRGVTVVISSAGLVVAFWIGLVTLRAIQSRNVAAMLNAYLHAPKIAASIEAPDATGLRKISMPSGQLYPHQFLNVVLHGVSCGAASVTFRYEKRPDADLTRTISLPPKSMSEQSTQIFVPVYKFFEGIEISSTNPSCLIGVFTIGDDIPTPLLMTVVLSPDWKDGPLFQAFGTW